MLFTISMNLIKAFFIFTLYCHSPYVLGLEIESCIDILRVQERGLFHDKTKTIFPAVTDINSNKPPVSMSFISHYDLSFEYINGERKTSLIALTSKGELYNLFKNDEDWHSTVIKLSGDNKIKDYKVSSKGKIIVTFVNKPGVFVFSSKVYFEDEDREPHTGLLGVISSALSQSSYDRAFIEVDVLFDDEDWFLNSEVESHSIGNLAIFDTVNLPN